MGYSEHFHAAYYYHLNTRQVLITQNITFFYCITTTPYSGTPALPVEGKHESKQLPLPPIGALPSSGSRDTPSDTTVTTDNAATSSFNSQPSDTSFHSSIYQSTLMQKDYVALYDLWKCPWAQAHLATKDEFALIANANGDPQSLTEAQSCPDWPEWKAAIDCKIA